MRYDVGCRRAPQPLPALQVWAHAHLGTAAAPLPAVVDMVAQRLRDPRCFAGDSTQTLVNLAWSFATLQPVYTPPSEARARASVADTLISTPQWVSPGDAARTFGERSYFRT